MSGKKQTKKPSPKKKAYELKTIVSIDGKDKLPGEKVNLTEKARRLFKSKKRI